MPGTVDTDGPASDDPDDGGASNEPLYFYLSKYRLGSNDDAQFTLDLNEVTNPWADLGFDLDKSCKNSPSCQVNGQNVVDVTCAPHTESTLPLDGNGCRDNTIGRLFKLAAASNPGFYFGMTEADWNCELRRGAMSVIFKVSQYNRQKNDRQVRLDMYTSVGLVNPSSFLCRSKLGTNGQLVQAIDGTLPLEPPWYQRAFPPSSAHWRVTAESIAPNADPTEDHNLPDARWNDPIAYVRNGYLVAHLPDGTEYWLNGKNAAVPGFRLIVSQPILVAKLSTDKGEWTMSDATLAGLIEPNIMIRSFREFGFCENMCTSYNLVVSTLTDNQDALLGSKEPKPDVKCNALTWGGQIEARQATVWKEDLDAPAAHYPPLECPEPAHPAAPRQGQGPCQLADAGADSGAADGGT